METVDYIIRTKQGIKIYKINWILVKVKMKLYLVYNPTIKFVNVKSKGLVKKFDNPEIQ